MRVVCDTNVLISALITDGLPEKIVQAALRGKITLFTSPELCFELTRVLQKAFRWTVSDADGAMRFFGRLSIVVKPKEHLRIITKDLSDNHILECAGEAEADVIVSGDKKHVLPLKRWRKIPILSPREFVLQALY